MIRTKIDTPAWQTLLAFAIIYFVWGSTYLAVRVGVREVPPFLLAAMRFLVAGLILYGWMMARGERSPSARQWTSALILAFLIFVLDYGLLFWAEQRVPSGIAAVMMATIPAFMALSEIIFLGTQRLTARLAVALLIGIGGVAVLVNHSLDLGGAPMDRAGAVALIVAAMSWSVASALARKLLRLIDAAEPRLREISEQESAKPTSPGGWSHKQVVGNLIDSASNNHPRFVRAALQASLDFPGYDQSGNVRVQAVQDADWGLLVTLWSAYNRYLAHVIGQLPEAKLETACRIGSDEAVTLGSW